MAYVHKMFLIIHPKITSKWIFFCVYIVCYHITCHITQTIHEYIWQFPWFKKVFMLFMESIINYCPPIKCSHSLFSPVIRNLLLSYVYDCNAFVLMDRHKEWVRKRGRERWRSRKQDFLKPFTNWIIGFDTKNLEAGETFHIDIQINRR